MTISRWGSKNRDFLGREEPNEAKPSGESSAQNVSNFESTHLEMGFSSRILGRNEFFKMPLIFKNSHFFRFRIKIDKPTTMLWNLIHLVFILFLSVLLIQGMSFVGSLFLLSFKKFWPIFCRFRVKPKTDALKNLIHVIFNYFNFKIWIKSLNYLLFHQWDG